MATDTICSSLSVGDYTVSTAANHRCHADYISVATRQMHHTCISNGVVAGTPEQQCVLRFKLAVGLPLQWSLWLACLATS